MAQPSPRPVRYPTGVSTDFPWGPLAQYGRPNPFGYHTWADDFDLFPTAAYTATKTNAGTIAQAAGDGGRLLFTTAALVTDNCVLTPVVASFKLNLGKKAFFLARLQLSSALNAGFICGLLAATTTPFTGTPADGIWIAKASGSLGMTINSTVGSVLTTLAIPTAALTLTDATDFDISFHLTRAGVIEVYVGAQMVGWLPQSGVGTQYGGRGAVTNITPAALTAVNLMPVLAVLAGTASAKTMNVDFALAATER